MMSNMSCDISAYVCSRFIPFCMIAQSRVSAEKKDYYDSKLMLHWSYICTFAGCFIGGMALLGAIVYFSITIPIAVRNANYR